MTSRTPFDDLERIIEQMQENIESATRMWDPQSLEPSAAAGMNVDLEDAGDEFVLTGDLPGFETDDIDLRVTDRTLHVSAERGGETETETGEYVRRERRHTSISRSVQLPGVVDVEGITASYNNGVLTVRMPKMDPGSEGTQIDVD